MPKFSKISQLNKAIKACTACHAVLPFAPQPILQINERAKILIVGQAPSLTVHQTKTLWNDASGKRLVNWLGISFETLYNPHHVAIMPMGFCYPGRAASGDLPPRKECAALWHNPILKLLTNVELTILVGSYAQAYFLGKTKKSSLTETVRNWPDYAPRYFPLPHPSPLNNIWLRKNPWFNDDIIPCLQKTVKDVLYNSTGKRY